MNTMSRWFGRLSRVGLAIGLSVSTAQLAQASDALRGSRDSRSNANRAPVVSSRVVHTMIEDALRDGKLEASEREMIMSQARRLLSSSQAAAIEARLDDLSTLPSTAPTSSVRLGAPVELVENRSPREPITRVVLENPDESSSRHVSRASKRSFIQADHAEADDRAVGGCENGSCDSGCSTCLLDNMYLFSAVDAWRGPLDGDHSNNFGARVGFNAGMPLWSACGIGVQFGASYGAYDYHGRFDLSPETETSAIEDQVFITTGVFKHCDASCGPCTDRISWGLVYDRLIADNMSAAAVAIDVGQFRGQIAYACSEWTEVGLWGTFTDGSSDEFEALAVRHTTRSIDQLNLFCRRVWCTGADTRAYIGIAEDPGEFVIGSNASFPLNECWALFGGFQYILPSASGGPPGFRDEIWNVTAGIAFYPGGTAISKSVCEPCWQPLLPVAHNGSFALDLGFQDP